MPEPDTPPAAVERIKRLTCRAGACGLDECGDYAECQEAEERAVACLNALVTGPAEMRRQVAAWLEPRPEE